MTLSLHFRHHFTHAAATDASLQHDAEGRRGVAIGIWSGVQPDYEGDMRGTEADWRTEWDAGCGGWPYRQTGR